MKIMAGYALVTLYIYLVVYIYIKNINLFWLQDKSCLWQCQPTDEITYDLRKYQYRHSKFNDGKKKITKHWTITTLLNSLQQNYKKQDDNILQMLPTFPYTHTVVFLITSKHKLTVLGMKICPPLIGSGHGPWVRQCGVTLGTTRKLSTGKT